MSACVYAVRDEESLQEQLVIAHSPAQALGFVARDRFKVRVAGSLEVAQAAAKGKFAVDATAKKQSEIGV